MNLKSIVFFAFAFCGVLATPVVGFARSNAVLPPDVHAGPPPHDPARELAHLSKSLKLTAEQQNQIRPILEERDEQMHNLHDDTSLTREESVAKGKGILEKSDSAIEAVLDSEQKEKFEKQRRAMEERMAHRHDNSAPPDGTPEPDGGGPPGGDGPPPDGPPGL
jgi:Spy/CpxP family protein refolding chaperone